MTGHVLAHRPDNNPLSSGRVVKEIEAESIAFIVAATLDLDTSAYSFPYVAHWARDIGELAAVQATAERVINHARRILEHLNPSSPEPPGPQRHQIQVRARPGALPYRNAFTTAITARTGDYRPHHPLAQLDTARGHTATKTFDT